MLGNKPSKKKVSFPINEELNEYLGKHNRLKKLPIQYWDLMHYQMSIPLLDLKGEDTLWETIFFNENERSEVHQALKEVYALLKTDGDVEALEHLIVTRIDYCTFGNTQPFRVRIINRINDNYDHFYVKRVDASRIYGLELEELMSPNDVIYLMDDETLIEEHIIGVTGTDFVEDYLPAMVVFDEIRIVKEFVKFNERCFVRLLGDMRAYNYVVDITPDIEGSQFRIRAIDFDQQSYEGGKNFYLPQYFKENNPIIFLGIKHLKPETMRQYQLEERSLMASRIKNDFDRVNELMEIMVKDTVSNPEKVNKLKNELAQHHKNNIFLKCKNMGEIVLTNIQLLLRKELKQSIL
ncbi:MAG: hypothetical protein ACI97N_001840 [Cognaticolwellia sp.]|jgi:hypothetical protein